MTPTQHAISIPADKRDLANAELNAVGFQGDNFPVPLSTTGSAPATHYGCNVNASPQTLNRFYYTLDHNQIDYQSEPCGHDERAWDCLLAATGLQQVVEEEIEEG
jgi:hypothetical protein